VKSQKRLLLQRLLPLEQPFKVQPPLPVQLPQGHPALAVQEEQENNK
jgi:hypothetical protein